ncbi:pseudouridine synthase [Rickettsiales bacterium]|nr:pseudouridine synthase [Rickettsiales bacterium]
MERKPIRLVKLISHAGFCSRREAEKLIENGEVFYENKPFKNFIIDPKLIKNITIKGKSLEKQSTRLWIFNKTLGLICSNSNQYNKKTVFDVLPKNFPRVVSVGRLDINSEGLLLFTNNPSLSTFLEHPKNNIERKYHVRTKGKYDEINLENLSKGITLKKIKYKPLKLKTIIKKKDITDFEIKIFEGKNREIRKLLYHFGLKVIRLRRIEYGPFKISDTKRNSLSEIKGNQLKKNLEILGFKNESDFWTA